MGVGGGVGSKKVIESCCFVFLLTYRRTSLASLLSFSICFNLFFWTSSILAPLPPVLTLLRDMVLRAVLPPSSPTPMLMNWSSKLISVEGRSCWSSCNWAFKSDTFGKIAAGKKKREFGTDFERLPLIEVLETLAMRIECNRKTNRKKTLYENICENVRLLDRDEPPFWSKTFLFSCCCYFRSMRDTNISPFSVRLKSAELFPSSYCYRRSARRRCWPLLRPHCWGLCELTSSLA